MSVRRQIGIGGDANRPCGTSHAIEPYLTSGQFEARSAARTTRRRILSDAATPTTLAAIESLHNVHHGESCFVVGNGPSLRRVRLEALEGHWFFGVNRGYLAYAGGLPPIPYYVFADPHGYNTLASEIRAAKVGRRFYRRDVCLTEAYALAHDREEALDLPFHVAPGMDEGHFATHLSQGLFRGYTVATDAIQVAYHMGFASVYLLGCDFDYRGESTHFYPTGAYEDRRRSDMPVAKVSKALDTAARAFEADGRRLVNVTAGSALDVLPREDFETVVRSLRQPARRSA